MKFRTEYKAREAEPLRPADNILLIGSCFSTNIGGKMREALMPAAVNPCGTLFNPASIAACIREALTANPQMHIFNAGSRWCSWLMNSDFAAQSHALCEERCAAALSTLRHSLISARTLIITFGTAWVYELEDSALIVGNCHKQPASVFNRRAMTAQEITTLWSGLIRQLRKLNNGLRIIFTVSPIRHLRDGFRENTISKSILHLAVDELCKSTGVEYFEAYEIQMDDLRDYRFYDADLAHPSPEAVNYIWECFQLTYYSSADRAAIAAAAKLGRRLRHRPINQSDDLTFEAETQKLITDFIRRNPGFVP